jgi:plastocyanin
MRIRAVTVLALTLGLFAGMLDTSAHAMRGPTRPAGVQAFHVSITEFMFTPQRLLAHVGDIVIWTNDGAVSHTTTAKGLVWDSGTLSPGDQFQFTFTTAGVFLYRCQIHPTQMRAGIKVLP